MVIHRAISDYGSVTAIDLPQTCSPFNHFSLLPYATCHFLICLHIWLATTYYAMWRPLHPPLDHCLTSVGPTIIWACLVAKSWWILQQEVSHHDLATTFGSLWSSFDHLQPTRPFSFFIANLLGPTIWSPHHEGIHFGHFIIAVQQ